MKSEPLELIVITDAHYYSKELGTCSKSYDSFCAKSQKCVAESEEIIKAAFAQIAKSSCKNVIFCGDATCDGDAASHAEFTVLLKALQKCGKNVYAITSTHDYKDNGITYRYSGSVKEEIPSLSRDDLKRLYSSFGPETALSVWEDGLSYVTELEEGYTLFALNSDKNGNGRSGYFEEMLSWIKENAELAKRKGRELIAFTHHPLISPSPVYSLIGKNDMMGCFEEIREFLSDTGFEIIFTGHSHINNISYFFSKKGKVLYDVSGSALTGYPAIIRYVTVKNNGYEITGRKITEKIDIELNGENADELMKKQFFRVADGFLSAPEMSTEELAGFTNAISISQSFTYRFGWLIKAAVKLLRRLTFGQLLILTGKKTGLKKQDIQKVCNKKISDFIKECALNLYAGNAFYSPDTAEFKITAALCSIIEGIPGVPGIMKKYGSLSSLILPLLYNGGLDDTNAFLPKNPSEEDLKKLCGTCPENVPDKKRGTLLFTAAVILLPLTLCLLLVSALSFAAGYGINYLKYYKEIRGCEK